MSEDAKKEYAPHQQRVIDERNELQAKFSNLGVFILDNPIFNTLDVEEQFDLRSQHDVMGEYLDILGRRILRF